jgi:predicted ATP-binding protein involved in virulence
MDQPFIKKITLRNFKCYKELTLNLKSGINILYGVNGTGKTSILKAINMAASAFLGSFKTLETQPFMPSDLRLAIQNGMPYPQYQFPIEIETEGLVLNTKVNWSIGQKSMNASSFFRHSTSLKLISETADTAVRQGETLNLPLIAYFSTQRLFVQSKISKKKLDGRLSGYHNALDATNIREQIKFWLKDAEYEQYQKRQTQPNFTNMGLETIKKLILTHFEEWKRIYYYEPAFDTRLFSGIYIEREDGSIIPEPLLSDGYRNFLWLFLEIAWRCYMLNPFLNEKIFDETTGIVTIDEIDLHLHPTWQQKVVSKLKNAFPKVQFVITTHSPIILSAADAHVLLLDGDKVLSQNKLYGMKPTHILEMYMQTMERLPQHQTLIEQYFKLINEEKGKSEEGLQLRKALENTLSKEDSLFTKADTLIDFLYY